MKTNLLTAFFFLTQTAFAASFVIADGETVNATQELSDSNDTGVIESGGTIDTFAAGNEPGVLMNSTGGVVTGQSITNHGTIRTGAGGTQGVLNQSGGNDATITNTGLIETTGNSTGIVSNADNTTVINTGIISSELEAVVIRGENGTLVNSGTISSTGGSPLVVSTAASALFINSGILTTSGDVPQGVEFSVESSSSTFINRGTVSVTATGIGASGFIAEGTATNARVINEGTISIEGDSASAIEFDTVGSRVENSGLITASGFGSIGILSNGDDQILINSGTIIGLDGSGFAILSIRSSATLDLLRGSNIQGRVSTVNPLNLSVQKGLNLFLSLNDTSAGFGNLDINMPFVVVDDAISIATVDPSSFVMQVDMLEDLTDSILDSLYHNQTDFLHCSFPCGSAWIEGLGSNRKRERDEITTFNQQGGFLVGAGDTSSERDAFNWLFGGSWGEGKVQSDTAKMSSESFFGGFSYERLAGGTFFAGALLGGYFSSRNERIVMNNLAPGGVQKASSSPSGGLLTCELYASHWLLRTTGFRPLLSGALRYSGLFLGGYDETGSSSNLSVENRHISLIKPKLELSFFNDFSLQSTDLAVQPYVGVAGRFQVGGENFRSRLLGLPLNFITDAPAQLAEFLYGFYGSATRERCSFYFHAQGLCDSEDSTRFLAEAGLRKTY